MMKSLLGSKELWAVLGTTLAMCPISKPLIYSLCCKKSLWWESAVSRGWVGCLKCNFWVWTWYLHLTISFDKNGFIPSRNKIDIVTCRATFSFICVMGWDLHTHLRSIFMRFLGYWLENDNKLTLGCGILLVCFQSTVHNTHVVYLMGILTNLAVTGVKVISCMPGAMTEATQNLLQKF